VTVPCAGLATLFAGGTFAIESPVQKRLNFPETKDDVFKIAMQHSHWTLNARIIADAVRGIAHVMYRFLLFMELLRQQSPLTTYTFLR
jgi:hypothetical protein